MEPTQLCHQLMNMLVQPFDGREGWLPAVAEQTISIQPLTETTLAKNSGISSRQKEGY